MDALSDPAIATVVVPKAAQVGWTEIVNNVAAFHIAQDPAPILVIQPTLQMGEAWSKDRFAPMLRDTPALRGRIQDPRSRDSGNTLLHKSYSGGHITIVGANSPASLASRPIRIVLADEVDRYPISAGSEGDPLKLAAKRQTTFWNRKTMLGSTPTLKATSVVWREWERSDKRRFMVPCPHCRHPQHLRWEGVRWDKVKNDAGDTIAHHPHTAYYACEECAKPWSDVQRWEALRKGEWHATAEYTGIAGFHVPGFLSPWLKLEQIVREFLEARERPELLQVWVNTVLGEPWEEKGETVQAGTLVSRAEAYSADTLPDEVVALTAGIDTQDDRLEIQVIGFGPKEEAWPCLYEVLQGDPAQPQVWKDLDEILLRSFGRENGQALRIRAACIDSGGHHAEAVYRFCRTRRGRRVFATKGAAGSRPIWPKRASRGGLKGAEQVHIVGVDTAKDALYARLRIQNSGPGYIHFPADDGFDEAYFAQLTSEQVVTRYRQGRPYRVWVLPKGRRNEALDTFVLAMAAMKSLPTLRAAPAAMPAPTPDATPLAHVIEERRPPMPPRAAAPSRPVHIPRRSGWLAPRR